VKQSSELITIKLIRGAIGELLHDSGATLDQTAGTLGLSARTLQRRLSEHGLSYSRLLAEMRFLKARELIQQQEKISDVALRLGYADAGSFTRAFERWAGMSPLQYRKRHCRRSHSETKYSHKK
jgi:AraC-like DNA-binding protein